MMLLDHMTRGRAMFGSARVPVYDAVKMGLNPADQRRSSNEALESSWS